MNIFTWDLFVTVVFGGTIVIITTALTMDR